MKCPKCQFEFPDPPRGVQPVEATTTVVNVPLKSDVVTRHAPARSINDSFDALFQHPVEEEKS